MTSIYLIRHAQARGNLEQRVQGLSDTLLTPLGQEQAACVGRRMQAVTLDAVYSSPLRRALDTARSIASLQNLEPLIVDNLTEIDGGAMENMRFDELKIRYPEAFHNFIERPHLFEGIGGGESMHALFARVRDAVLGLARRHPDGTIALVSHGAALRCFLCYASGLPIDQMTAIPWGDNTAVSHVTFDDAYKPTLCFMSDTSHLQEHISTDGETGVLRT